MLQEEEDRYGLGKRAREIRTILGSYDCHSLLPPSIVARLVDQGLVPRIPDLDEQVLRSIRDTRRFHMGTWHSMFFHGTLMGGVGQTRRGLSPAQAIEQAHRCGTTHCIAGWAITTASTEGAILEAALSPFCAGSLLFQAAYPGRPVPLFDGDLPQRSALRWWAFRAGVENPAIIPLFQETLGALEQRPLTGPELGAIADRRIAIRRERAKLARAERARARARARTEVTAEERARVAAIIAEAEARAARRSRAPQAPPITALTRDERRTIAQAQGGRS